MSFNISSSSKSRVQHFFKMFLPVVRVGFPFRPTSRPHARGVTCSKMTLDFSSRTLRLSDQLIGMSPSAKKFELRRDHNTRLTSKCTRRNPTEKAPLACGRDACKDEFLIIPGSFTILELLKKRVVFIPQMFLFASLTC